MIVDDSTRLPKPRRIIIIHRARGKMGDHVLMGFRASRVALMQNEYLLRTRAFRGNLSSPGPFRGQASIRQKAAVGMCLSNSIHAFASKQDLRPHRVLCNQARL
jgi:hypothetical protein